jgi:hypothetical protein
MGKLLSICPECNKPRELRLFYMATNIIFDCIHIKRKYTAVCPKCQTLFSLRRETGDRLYLKLTASITPSDLTPLKKGTNNARDN